MKYFVLINLVLVGCKTGMKIEFDPNFYVGDYENTSIVNRDGFTIRADSPSFNQFACLSEAKIDELVSILRRARIPKKTKKFYVEQIRNLQDYYPRP